MPEEIRQQLYAEEQLAIERRRNRLLHLQQIVSYNITNVLPDLLLKYHALDMPSTSTPVNRLDILALEIKQSKTTVYGSNHKSRSRTKAVYQKAMK